MVAFNVAGERAVTPVEVSAEILRVLKQAPRTSSAQVGGAVITVPAYFDDAQRQATKDAGRLAGLDVLRLLNEPTAAALAYGLEKKQNGTFAVYDLGGGTFDVTILVLDDGVFQVRSTGGDSALGGDDMDRALAEVFLREHGLRRRRRRAAGARAPGARRARARSSTRSPIATAVELEIRAARRRRRSSRSVTRAELDALDAPAPRAHRRRLPARAAATPASQPSELDGVILVGGSTRVPLVRALRREALRQRAARATSTPIRSSRSAPRSRPTSSPAADRATTCSCSTCCRCRSASRRWAAWSRRSCRATRRSPRRAAQMFTTYADNQTGFELHVVQGERELAADCRSLARFTLKRHPADAGGPGAARGDASDVDADGLLHVDAREEQTTGIEQQSRSSRPTA